MKIELLADYRGVLTGELYYTAGVYGVPDNMPKSYANALVEEGRAVICKLPAEDDTPPNPNYQAMTVKRLRALATERGISTTGLRKANLVRALEIVDNVALEAD